jgi:hypothetical protein
MSPKKDAQKPARKAKGLTAEERAAMKERMQDEDGESAVLAKIAEMSEPDRAMAKRIHAIIRASAPSLTPRLWYGMPAYSKDDQTLCFFQSAQKFKSRYATLGFNQAANLDEGAMWPVAYALKELTAAEEKRISALVKKAVS